MERTDFDRWQPLWDGYNAFYGRKGETALPDAITQTTWERFFDPAEPVYGLVALVEGKLAGLTHFLFHRSTTRVEATCYLQDLFTLEQERGRGIGRALIEAVYSEAHTAGVRRVFWQTHTNNLAGRMLYDKLARHDGFIVYSQDV